MNGFAGLQLALDTAFIQLRDPDFDYSQVIIYLVTSIVSYLYWKKTFKSTTKFFFFFSETVSSLSLSKV